MDRFMLEAALIFDGEHKQRAALSYGRSPVRRLAALEASKAFWNGSAGVW
jgi:hypothetical protein